MLFQTQDKSNYKSDSNYTFSDFFGHGETLKQVQGDDYIIIIRVSQASGASATIRRLSGAEA